MNIMNIMKRPSGGGLRKNKTHIFLNFCHAKGCFWLINLHDVHKLIFGVILSWMRSKMTGLIHYFMNVMQFYVEGEFKRFFLNVYVKREAKRGQFNEHEKWNFIMFIKSSGEASHG